ncbi:hypothetical protein NIIDMKKI_19350 [Mycobacterium kansasii]|uniref:Uncharacterized protein n=1 Tax=Mycobacterium kansasii TaxID=1768 RepID=A0A7G1IB26_MYCKA|nr:hypothetical protein NIIDMKKI_19350 [Mycobacterium kansasii]
MADATQPHSGSANSQPEVRAWAEQADAAGEDDAEYSDADYEYVDYDEFVAADDETDEVEGQDAAEAAAPEAGPGGGCGCCWPDSPRPPRWSSSAASPRSAESWYGSTTRPRSVTNAPRRSPTGPKGIINMISLDFRKAKEDVQRVIDSSTGEFKDEFQQRAADFTKVVEQSKVVTEGTVTATAVESMDGNTALVLVSATSRVTNGGNGKEEPREWRLKVTVTEEDGQYKMSKVEFVP